MSTNATISIRNADDTVVTAYCHFDGYVDGLGADLVGSYNSEDLVRELIAGGDMRYIGDYYKDRGETEVGPIVQSHDDYLGYLKVSDMEYNYIFSNGIWICRNGDTVFSVEDFLDNQAA